MTLLTAWGVRPGRSFCVSRASRYFFFGGGAAFTGAGFAAFFGFFFSLPRELLPLPIAHLGSGDTLGVDKVVRIAQIFRKYGPS
jgi:hypothetical protein